MSLVNCITLNPLTHAAGNVHQKYLSANGYKRRLILTPKEHTHIISFVKDILSKKPELKFGKKVYLGSLSNLPRHKVKEYFTNNNTKKTSRIEQADTIIIDRGCVKDLFKFLTIKPSNYDLDIFKTYLIDKPENKQKLIPIVSTYYGDQDKIHEITSSNIPFYILTNTKQYQPTSHLNPYLKDITPEDLYVNHNWSNHTSFLNTYEIIEFLDKNPNINILFDDDILPLINNEGIDLDPEYLDILDNMFESKNQENINLALEMLSNVDIKKHTLTLALFLNKHMDKFFSGSGLNINQNRSFKSFIKYFEAKKINFRSHWKKFSVDLLTEYKNNPENIKIINDFIVQNINNYLKTAGHEVLSNHIKIENCTIKL